MGDVGLLRAIKTRFTDRSLYLDKQVESEKLEKIEKCNKNKDILVKVSNDQQIRELTSILIKKGMKMALSTPNFRKELSELINTPSSNSRVGISSGSLLKSTVGGIVEPQIVKLGLGIKRKADHEYRLWMSSTALIFVFSRGDSSKYWLEAGRIYQRAGLLSTSLGLRQATSAAIVEALDFHKDIERRFNTEYRLQTVMRIGYSNARPSYSPRLDVDHLFLDS